MSVYTSKNATINSQSRWTHAVKDLLSLTVRIILSEIGEVISDVAKHQLHSQYELSCPVASNVGYV